MIEVSYPKILDLFREHLDPKRSESASFLIWYLQNYYRLDRTEAVDAVCDQRGDKGVDGIFVNDNDQTITIFQSRIQQDPKATIGDKGLREFVGTMSQFETADKIQNLIDTAGHAQVAALAKRLDLVSKIKSHELRGEFVANSEMDANGTAYLKGETRVVFVGRQALVDTFISDERDKPVHAPAVFDISGFTATRYTADKEEAIIAPILAKELVTMSGIADQSLFTYNVRGPLGRTKVNRDIAKTIRDKALHKLFPLFHNGITVIAGNLEADKERLKVEDYFVVNGCQSLTALHANSDHLTDNLRVLTKFIKIDPASDLAAQITDYSNNQNPPKPRDSKSNNAIQIRLQNDFRQYYAGVYGFEIKQGEEVKAGTPISNETAGLYLRAFDLREPWVTHRKFEVFEDKYSEIFGRPEVTADRIVLCQVIMEEIEKAVPNIENKLFGKYAL